MADQSPAETKMAELLVEALNLEDVSAAEIDPEAPLFGDGLGLDSIDALEIALAIPRNTMCKCRLKRNILGKHSPHCVA